MKTDFRLYIYYILVMLTAGVGSASASDQPEYYTRWMSLPSGELLDKAEHFAYDTGQADSALVCFNIVAHREQKGMSRDETLDVIRAYNGLWNAYFYNFYNFAKATESLLRAQTLSSEIGASKARIYLNFGNMYMENADKSGSTGMYRKATAYYKQAIAAARHDGKPTVMVVAFINLLISSRKAGQSDTAQHEWQLLQEAHLKPGLMTDYARLLYEGLLAIHRNEGTKAAAIFRRQQALMPDTVSAFVRYRTQAMTFEAEAYACEGRYEKALATIQSVLSIASSENLEDVKIEALPLAAQYHKALHQDEQALKLQEQFVAVKDSLLGLQQKAAADQLSFLEEQAPHEGGIAPTGRPRTLCILYHRGHRQQRGHQVANIVRHPLQESHRPHAIGLPAHRPRTGEPI